MSRDNLCPICGDYHETVMYVIRDREETKYSRMILSFKIFRVRFLVLDYIIMA